MLVQIMLQREAAHDSVEELAELGCVQFVDSDANEVKTAFQRAWVTEAVSYTHLTLPTICSV